MTKNTEWRMKGEGKEKPQIKCNVCQEKKDANTFLAIGTWNGEAEVFDTNFFLCKKCQEEKMDEKTLKWLREVL